MEFLVECHMAWYRILIPLAVHTNSCQDWGPQFMNIVTHAANYLAISMDDAVWCRLQLSSDWNPIEFCNLHVYSLAVSIGLSVITVWLLQPFLFPHSQSRWECKLLQWPHKYNGTNQWPPEGPIPNSYTNSFSYFYLIPEALGICMASVIIKLCKCMAYCACMTSAKTGGVAH